MKPKVAALALLGALSLACPLVEVAVTGRAEPFSKFWLAETFLSIAPLYWWYHTDKQQWNYQAGPLMNVGVIAVAIVALPVYFIRTRGWKRGAIAILLALGVLVATAILGEIGEFIGGFFC